MRIILVVCFTLLLFAGCAKKVVTLKSGLRYSIDTVGNGVVAKKGDFVSLNFKIWIVKDSSKMFKDWSRDTTQKANLIGDNRQSNQPAKFVLGSGVLLGAEEVEGIEGMKKGETRSIIVPSNLAFGERGPVSKLKFTVTLLDVKPQLNMWKLDAANMQTTPSGLKYMIIQKGYGPYPDSGKTVIVHYSGFLTNGKRFDSSVERGEPFVFTVGMHQVIPGWEEGILLMNKGTKARLIIPPSLAFNNKKVGQIPANSDLIFDVELVDIK